MVKEKQELSINPVDAEDEGHELILFNDDFNTFEYVIDSLIEVCGHTPEQAEQCTLVAHSKGKCTVKKGDFTDLEPMHNEMGRRGLTTSIN